MVSQGYHINQNIFFQDNKSVIKIEKNGKKLFTDNSSHNDIRYLFSKYRVESKTISIAYCSI